MSLWIKIDTELPRNRKTYQLADLLIESSEATLMGELPYSVWRARAIALLLDFWRWVADHYPDGDVTQAYAAEVRDAVRPWLDGTAWLSSGDVRDLLVRSGHIDRRADSRLAVHDWFAWSGSAIDRMARDRRRQVRRRRVVGSGSFTKQDWTELLDLVRHRCAYCGRVLERLGMDHVIPLTRRGKHVVGNVVPACRRCNNIKGNRLPAEADMAFNAEVIGLIEGSRFGVSKWSPSAILKSPNLEQKREEKRRSDKIMPAAPTVVRDYATRCVIAVNATLEGKLAGVYKPLVADVERETAVAWEAKGIRIELAEAVLAEVTLRFQSRPHNRQPATLRYFEGAILEAHAADQASASGQTYRDPIGAALAKIGREEAPAA